MSVQAGLHNHHLEYCFALMSEKDAKRELEILLWAYEKPDDLLALLKHAQSHYIDLINSTSDGLFILAQLHTEYSKKSHASISTDNVFFIEELQCVNFMSKAHNLPLELCSAYVLSKSL